MVQYEFRLLFFVCKLKNGDIKKDSSYITCVIFLCGNLTSKTDQSYLYNRYLTYILLLLICYLYFMILVYQLFPNTQYLHLFNSKHGLMWLCNYIKMNLGPFFAKCCRATVTVWMHDKLWALRLQEKLSAKSYRLRSRMRYLILPPVRFVCKI